MVGPSPGNAQDLGAESRELDLDSCTDMRGVALLTYLEEMGKEASSLSNSALNTAIQLALEGRDPADLKDKSLATFTWKMGSRYCCRSHLPHLRQGLGEILVRDFPDESKFDIGQEGDLLEAVMHYIVKPINFALQ